MFDIILTNASPGSTLSTSQFATSVVTKAAWTSSGTKGSSSKNFASPVHCDSLSNLAIGLLIGYKSGLVSKCCSPLDIPRVMFSAPDLTAGEASYPEPEEIFTTGRSHYAGQAVGLIVAETKDVATLAATKVKISYKNVEKPILTIEEALHEQIVSPTTGKAWLKYISTLLNVKVFFRGSPGWFRDGEGIFQDWLSVSFPPGDSELHCETSGGWRI